MRHPYWIVVILSAIVLPPRPAAAVDRFDLIYPGRIDVYFSPGIHGFVLGAVSYALLVNTGSTPITADETSQATFACVSSSVPGFQFSPFVAYLSSYSPIATTEAVGSVRTGNNGVLLNPLLPGEVFRNTYPGQVLALAFYEPDPPGNYEGAVLFDVVMRLGDKQVSFQTEVDVHQGATSPSWSFANVSRVSTAATVAAKPLTWGKLKSLYR
jgi:hypothetical protein